MSGVPAILVTRTEPEAHETAAMIERLGGRAIIAPLRMTQGVKASAPEVPELIIATSAKAFRHGGRIPPTWLGCRVLVVGDRTEAAAREAGFTRIEATAGDVATLAPCLALADRQTRTVYLAGEPRKPDIENFARDHGLQLAVWLRYRMIDVDVVPPAARQALEAGDVGAILHFSAESALSFMRLAQAAGLSGIMDAPLHVCISESVAQVIRAHASEQALPKPRIVISASKRGASLVETAISALRTKEQPQDH